MIRTILAVILTALILIVSLPFLGLQWLLQKRWPHFGEKGAFRFMQLSFRIVRIPLGIRLDVNFPEERIEIKGDEVQLRKAVVNLLSNALRHAQSYIETACSAENKSVLITVANDGTPLDKEMQKRVFERFYSGPDGSTGIGLALTKDIVELHRGTICAKGKDGRTVFEIRLPK